MDSDIMRPLGLITYEGLPFSSGNAHHFRSKKLKASWSQFERLLAECTDCIAPVLCIEHCVSKELPEEFRIRIESDLLERFGKPEHCSTVSGAAEECRNKWVVPRDRVVEALDWMQAQCPLPAYSIGAPLCLTVSAQFKFRDPDSGKVFPFQGFEIYDTRGYWREHAIGMSSIFLRLSEKSTCVLLLTLPFPEPSEAVVAFVAKIQERLPFRLSAKHWKWWRMNKKGTGYYDRRVDVLKKPGDS